MLTAGRPTLCTTTLPAAPLFAVSKGGNHERLHSVFWVAQGFTPAIRVSKKMTALAAEVTLTQMKSPAGQTGLGNASKYATCNFYYTAGLNIRVAVRRTTSVVARFPSLPVLRVLSPQSA
jgi:hypothetical protein